MNRVVEMRVQDGVAKQEYVDNVLQLRFTR